MRQPNSKNNTGTVEKFIDTAYDNVKIVADNIDDVNTVAAALGNDEFKEIIDNLPEILMADDNAAIATAKAAEASASEQSAQDILTSLTQVLAMRGDWDASAGNFPPESTNPKMSDMYRISVAGTMTNANQTMAVDVNERIYVNPVTGIWFSMTVTGDKADKTTTIETLAASGLLGGGDLSTDRQLSLNDADARNVDHSTVNITTGAGMSGDGTLESDIALTVNIDRGLNVISNNIGIGTLSDSGIDTSSGNAKVDITGTTESTTITGGDTLLVETSTGLKRITRDNLLAGVSGSTELRGSASPLSSMGVNDPIPTTDTLNPNITQGIAPAFSGVSANGYSYIVLLDPADHATGVTMNFGGASGSATSITMFDQDQLVWTNDQWTHLETGDAVISVFGRNGLIVAETNDYTAAQITNVPFGQLAGTTAQLAINSLETNKTSKVVDETVTSNWNFTGDLQKDGEDVAKLSQLFKPWQIEANSLEQFEADRAAEKQARNYNSGFNEFGNEDSSALGLINKGMWTYPAGVYSNILMMGGLTGTRGLSKTDFPVSSIAGVVSDIYGIGARYTSQDEFVFPSAPNGAVSYDSATGTIFDYETQSDPKYGNVAPDLNEAVARCFEGEVKNGDFRFGDTGDWTTIGTVDFSNGTARVTYDANNAGITQIISVTNGVEYEFELVVTEATKGFYSRIDGVFSPSLQAGTHKRTITATGSTMSVQIGTGTSAVSSDHFTVASASLRKTTVQPVVNRVDLAGIEYFLREVTLSDEMVYAKGAIQSQAVTMNGITTVANAQRPQTYFDQYAGQAGSKGKGINFWTGTDNAQRLDIVSDPSNNLYYNDGKLYQWCYRFRTFAGRGNGDWLLVDANTTTGDYLKYAHATDNILSAHGSRDSADSFGSGGTPYRLPYTITDTLSGVAKATGSSSSVLFPYAVNGECYYQSICVVNRLNSGAYHPSLNPMGTATFFSTATAVNLNNRRWYASDARQPVSTKNCFEGQSTTATLPAGNVAPFFYIPNGSIGRGTDAAGRPDGRYYDAIYANGQGGVSTDLRLSVTEDLDKAISTRKAQDKNGETRGSQAITFTKPHLATLAQSVNGNVLDMTSPPSRAGWFSGIGRPVGIAVGDKVHYYNSVSGDVATFTIDSITANGNQWFYRFTDASIDLIDTPYYDGAYFVVESQTNLTLADEFNQLDIIGSPSNILATPALSQGWFGSWIPVIPDGSSKEYLATRKLTSKTDMSFIYTNNSGSTWSSWTTSFNAQFSEVTNSHSWVHAPSMVAVTNYTAHTKHTEPTANPVVYRGLDGLRDIFSSAFYLPTRGALLGESLLGKVLISGSGDVQQGMLNLLSNNIDPRYGSLYLSSVGNYTGFNRHTPVEMTAPTDNSPAVKALFATTVVNGLVYPVYYYTELVYKAHTPININSGNATTDVALGDVLNIDRTVNSALNGNLWKAVLPTATDLDRAEWRIGSGHEVYWHDNTRPYFIPTNSVGDWGDDSLIHVVDNDGTMTDQNGNTVKVGIHIGTSPIGFEAK